MKLNEATLLVIEDNHETLELIVSLLQPYFYHLLSASTAEEALQLYRQEHPDIILSDINMPGINGLELARKIRKENREIPILLLTAHNDTETLMQAANLAIDGFIVKPVLEVDDLLRRLRETAKKIPSEKDFAAKNESIDMLRSKAYFDALTGLANAHSFREKLENLTAKGPTESVPFSLLYIDLDNLKSVNDRYGHLAGDRLLQSFARQIRQVAGEHFFARIGGDEFVMIVQNIVEKDRMHTLVQTMFESVAEGAVYKENRFPISCSIGICRYPTDVQESTELLERADRAMYQAKRQGKNTYVFCK